MDTATEKLIAKICQALHRYEQGSLMYDFHLVYSSTENIWYAQIYNYKNTKEYYEYCRAFADTVEEAIYQMLNSKELKDVSTKYT